jgi:hypothetical protein
MEQEHSSAPATAGNANLKFRALVCGSSSSFVLVLDAFSLFEDENEKEDEDEKQPTFTPIPK